VDPRCARGDCSHLTRPCSLARDLAREWAAKKRLDESKAPTIYRSPSEEDNAPMAKIMTTIYLDPPLYEEVRMISESTGKPVAAIVRESLRAWIDRRRKGKRTTVKQLP